MITDDAPWTKAQEIAKKEYEAENGESWEDADKYARQDLVFSVYTRLKAERR